MLETKGFLAAAEKYRAALLRHITYLKKYTATNDEAFTAVNELQSTERYLRWAMDACADVNSTTLNAAERCVRKKVKK